MPRIVLPKTILDDGKAGSTAKTITWTAADLANDHYYVWTGKEIVLARSLDASPHNATVTAAAAPQTGRVTNFTTAVPASPAVIALPDFNDTGWLQSGSQIFLEADSVQVQFAVLQRAR